MGNYGQMVAWNWPFKWLLGSKVMSAPPTTAVVETALMTMRPPVALNLLAKYTATSLLAGHRGVP